LAGGVDAGNEDVGEGVEFGLREDAVAKEVPVAMSTRVLTVAKALARPWMEPGERAELT
jgi:hypothetical protein